MISNTDLIAQISMAMYSGMSNLVITGIKCLESRSLSEHETTLLNAAINHTALGALRRKK